MGKIKIKKSGQSQQCRCCLKEIGLKELWTEYYNGEEREVYGEMVNDCFALPWEPLFGKTEHICDSCITRLRDAVSFKREILYSNQLLNQEAKNESKLSVKQEEESDLEMETEYLSIEFMDDEDKNLMEIKIEQESKSEMTVKEESSPSKRGKRYTEDDLKKCMEAVMSGKMSQTKASIVYHVPRKTISAAVANRGKKVTVQKKKISNNPKKRERSKHMDNITTLFNHTNATPLRCQKDIGYGCCFCDKFCEKPAELKQHTRQTHQSDIHKIMRKKSLNDYHVKLDITGLQCNECNTKTDNLEDMMRHLQEHNKNIHWDINNHIMPFSFDDDELRCVICKAEFNKFKKLNEHMNKHYRNRVCDVCGAGFINERTFRKHSIQVHKKGVFACKFCEKIFDTIGKKRSHESSVHIHSQMLNKCGYCNKKFKSHRNKEKHISSAHGVRLKEIKCKLCGKVCLTANALRVHTRRDHLKERNYQCHLCAFSSYGNSCLQSHMLKHTGVRDFQCDICLKSYAKKKTLKEHMRIHADDRRFKCEYCGLAFIQKCSLKGHMQSKHRDLVPSV
ncbi:zinc finger protein 99-like isoform X6 [Maniola jurtina]|uniref:zinc finger protein 99-like isoform X5 n=1 Tax=Maniola jurtina TaxID=191418 RepID=UPI001E68D95F|nr:zinc finger protein 99-like isoform X5 [Maniola jurtina]XP_045781614.1 zinc finger protein 99-like isoform X6 [Maniola jurtina]